MDQAFAWWTRDSRIRLIDSFQTYITIRIKRGNITLCWNMNRTNLIRMSIEIEGVEVKTWYLLHRDSIERKDLCLTLIAIPCRGWNVSSFAKSSTSQVVLFSHFSHWILLPYCNRLHLLHFSLTHLLQCHSKDFTWENISNCAWVRSVQSKWYHFLQ